MKFIFKAQKIDLLEDPTYCLELENVEESEPKIIRKMLSRTSVSRGFFAISKGGLFSMVLSEKSYRATKPKDERGCFVVIERKNFFQFQITNDSNNRRYILELHIHEDDKPDLKSAADVFIKRIKEELKDEFTFEDTSSENAAAVAPKNAVSFAQYVKQRRYLECNLRFP